MNVAPDRCPLRPFDRLGRSPRSWFVSRHCPRPLHPPFDPNFVSPPRSRWSDWRGPSRIADHIVEPRCFRSPCSVSPCCFESFPFDPDVSRNLCRPAPYCCSAGPEQCWSWSSGSASFASTADHRLREYPPGGAAPPDGQQQGSADRPHEDALPVKIGSQPSDRRLLSR